MRERSGEADYHEGMSSDDELTPSEVTEFQKSKGWWQSYCDVLEKKPVSDISNFFFLGKVKKYFIWLTYS